MLLLMGGVATWLYYHHFVTADRELEAALAEVEAADPRWRLEHIEADRAAVPDRENGALHVLAVATLIPQDWAGDNRFVRLFPEDYPPQARLNDAQVKALRDELARVPQALAEARKMKDFPRGRFPIDYAPDFISTLLKCQEARRVAHLLDHDAMLLAHGGAIDAALASCLGAFNASRAVGDEPMLISQLVRVALRAIAVQQTERALGQGRPSEAPLAALQKALEEDEPARLTLIGLRGERAGFDALLEAALAGEVDLEAALAGNKGGRAGAQRRLQSGPWLKWQRAAYLRCLTECVEATKLPYGPRHRELDRIAVAAAKEGGITGMFLPAAARVSEAEQRSVAQLRCGIVALATERYRLKHGRWPEEAKSLVEAGYLKQLPADPFDGLPLRWRRVEDGVVVYAVGADCADNGGKLDRDPRNPGTDHGFRLWDEARRAQAALLPPPDNPPPGAEPGPPGGIPGEPPGGPKDE
jgi:hypothetical protein